MGIPGTGLHWNCGSGGAGGKDGGESKARPVGVTVSGRLRVTSVVPDAVVTLAEITIATRHKGGRHHRPPDAAP